MQWLLKGIAVLAAELEELLAQPMDGTPAERTEAAFDWETFKSRCAAVDHRVVGSLKEVPAEEPGPRQAMKYVIA